MKKNLVLLLVFVVLGIIVFMQEDSRKKKSEERPEELGLLYPDFDPDSVKFMTFGSFGGSIELEKEADGWIVIEGENRFPADTEAVQKALDQTRDLEATQIVSKNPEKHVSFQVNASQQAMVAGDQGGQKPFTMGTMGTEVIMKTADGTDVAHFFIGKNGSVDFMTTYIRKDGQDEVLLTNGYLKMIYGKGNATAWKNLTLCALEVDEIERISLHSNNQTITLEQVYDDTDNAVEPAKIWKMTEPDRGKVDNPMLQRMTGMFRRFRAGDFAEKKEDSSLYGFDSSTESVTVKATDSEPRTFVFGNSVDESENQYYLKEQGSDIVYTVPKYRLETIQKSPDDFFEEQK